MKGYLGCEVHLREETLSEDNSATIDLLWTGAHLIYQAISAWTGLSPPAAYPSTVGYEANEGNV
jgi:hypothetical protein